MLIVAWGLFVLRTWAYIVTLAVQAINGIFALITVITVPRAWPAWIALVIAGFIIYYLLLPQVRETFGVGRDVS